MGRDFCIADCNLIRAVLVLKSLKLVFINNQRLLGLLQILDQLFLCKRKQKTFVFTTSFKRDLSSWARWLASSIVCRIFIDASSLISSISHANRFLSRASSSCAFSNNNCCSLSSLVFSNNCWATWGGYYSYETSLSRSSPAPLFFVLSWFLQMKTFFASQH